MDSDKEAFLCKHHVSWLCGVPTNGTATTAAAAAAAAAAPADKRSYSSSGNIRRCSCSLDRGCLVLGGGGCGWFDLSLTHV